MTTTALSDLPAPVEIELAKSLQQRAQALSRVEIDYIPNASFDVSDLSNTSGDSNLAVTTASSDDL